MTEQTHATEGSQIWYRLRIDDSGLARPDGFRQLFDKVAMYVNVREIKASGVEGVWRLAPTFLEKGEDCVTSPELLFRELERAIQLVWGRFYLLDNAPDSEQTTQAVQSSKDTELEDGIAGAAATICVADNTSCFVFTRSTALVCKLVDAYPLLQIMKNKLSVILEQKVQM